MKQKVVVTEVYRSGDAQIIIVKNLQGMMMEMFNSPASYAVWAKENIALTSE